MIHAFNFTCNRDLELSLLMVKTFTHCPDGSISISNTDTVPEYKAYGNGAGWQASMMKLKALSDIVKTKNVQDDDFVLSVDSDVVFCSPEVFRHVYGSPFGIIGTKHHPEFNTHMGQWSHMSGALIFIRGDIAKKMIALSTSQLNSIRANHFKGFNLTENEDVVLSYLASHVGAKQFDLGGLGLSSGDFESDVAKFAIEEGMIKGFYVGTQNMKSFYHLNYCPTQFLGEPVTGKWDIPRILKQKGIEF